MSSYPDLPEFEKENTLNIDPVVFDCDIDTFRMVKKHEKELLTKAPFLIPSGKHGIVRTDNL
jgi:hypothetical protein